MGSLALSRDDHDEERILETQALAFCLLHVEHLSTFSLEHFLAAVLGQKQGWTLLGCSMLAFLHRQKNWCSSGGLSFYWSPTTWVCTVLSFSL